MSSGFVHGTGSPASTTNSVNAMPSGKSTSSLPRSPSPPLECRAGPVKNLDDGVVWRDLYLPLPLRGGVDDRHSVEQANVVFAVPRLFEAIFLVKGVLLDVGQDQHAPAMHGSAIFAVHDG